MSTICLATDPNDDGGMFDLPHRCTLDRGHAGDHQSTDTLDRAVLHAWSNDTALLNDDPFWMEDAGLCAVTLNPYFGYLLVQPWANDDDWTRARELLEEFGGATDCTRLTSDTIRYAFTPEPV